MQVIKASKIVLLLWAILAIKQVDGKNIISDDSITTASSIQTNYLLRQIDFEKNRIAYHYKVADRRFFVLVDSVSEFIAEQDVPPEKKNLYLERLGAFLKNIHRSYSENYFRSGTYYALLGYYPRLIEWDQSDELLRNLNRYSSFSIKAARLIPSDTIAEEFLFSYLNDYPDDIFRYVEGFDDRKFAMPLLEQAVHLAPESANRYYATVNLINNTLHKSNDLYVKKSYEIYSLFGIRSHAFLLLDPIVNNQITIKDADSIGRNAYSMFHLLVHLASIQESNINYSMYRYINNYCIDVVRKINEELNQQGIFNLYSPEELFTLMCYGHKECTTSTFTHLLESISKKLSGTMVNSTIVAGIDKEKLKELIVYCDKNNTLKELLNLVDDDKKNYLLALTAEEERNVLFPTLKVFRTDTVQQDYKSDQATTTRLNCSPKETNLPTISSNIKQPYSKIKSEQSRSAVIPNNASASTENSVSISSYKADFIPAPLPVSVEPIQIELDEQTRTSLSMRKNILQTIQHIPSFIKKDYAEKLLLYAAQKEPDELFKKVDAFKNNRFSKKVLEVCALNAPVSVKKYLYNPSQPVNYILQYSSNPVVKKIFEINPEIGYRTKPLLLMDDIVKEKLSVKDAIVISSDPDKLFCELVKIVSQPTYIGKYSIDHEMRNYSLHFVREINDKIATGDPQPFSSAENFKSEDLYFLMLYGRDEVFTSTFNGLFARFIQELPNGNGTIFLNSINNNQFRDFISLCSNFGKMDEFLSKFSEPAKQQLLLSYTANLEKDQDALTTVVLVAEAISNITNYQVLGYLQSNIKHEYDRVKEENNPVGISIYGILSSMISGNATVDIPWYKMVAEQFKVSPAGLLATSTLFNAQKICVQQMYFYNDDDGKSSFLNFLSTYKNQSAWQIEDRGSYVIISSKEGKQIEIFANKPEMEEVGIGAINIFLKENKMSPYVVIHRGHSFHTEATLEKISSSAKLIFVGSCGGFYKVSMALENAPDAHVISTKQVGTKAINDAILFALNENIREGKDIMWNDFWDKMRIKLGNNQYFSDYIPPNKNLEATFIRAYYKLLGV